MAGAEIGAGEGNRTLTSSLGSSRSATELLPLRVERNQSSTGFEVRAISHRGTERARESVVRERVKAPIESDGGEVGAHREFSFEPLGDARGNGAE